MTLNVNQPTDQELNAMWPYWIRKLAKEINSISLSSTGVVASSVTVPAGTTSLSVGSELSSSIVELIVIDTDAGGSTLGSILGGTQGQVKLFVFQDNNLSLTDGTKVDGHFYLNQPVLTDFNAQQDDVIALINIDGDGSSIHGYWKELWRLTSVK